MVDFDRISGESFMAVTVLIPTPLQKLANDQASVQAEGATLREVVESLASQNADFKTRLLDDSGELRRFVNVYVNEEDVRFLQKLDTPLKDGDEVSIVPAIAGG
jgi:molybdopterin synthase sulfur carrier subunit